MRILTCIAPSLVYGYEQTVHMLLGTPTISDLAHVNICFSRTKMKRCRESNPKIMAFLSPPTKRASCLVDSGTSSASESKVWNTEPCTTHRKDVLARHEGSTMHKEAVEQERACQVVKAHGGIWEVVEGQVALHRSAVVVAMSMYQYT